MGFEVIKRTPIGFAAHMGEKSTVNYGSSQYAAALNSAGQYITHAAAAELEVAAKPVVVNYPFPDVSVVRPFDTSKTTKQWRRFEKQLGANCRQVGAKALRLSEMELVLVSPEQMNEAMTQSFRKEATQISPKLRTEAARRTSRAISGTIFEASKAHHAAYAQFLCGTSLAFQTKSPDELYDDYLLRETDDEAYCRKAPIVKADVLWQRHEPRAESTLVKTGDNAIGIILNDDSLGVFRTEAEMIAHGLKKAKDINFRSDTLIVPRHTEWLMTLAVDVFDGFPAGGSLLIPEIPSDIPLKPPHVKYQEY